MKHKNKRVKIIKSKRHIDKGTRKWTTEELMELGRS